MKQAIHPSELSTWRRLGTTAAVAALLSGCLGTSSSTPDAPNNIGAGGAPVTISLPVDFENTSATYQVTDFDGGSVVLINNPHAAGGNASARVAQMVKDGGQTWGGATLTLDNPIDFASGEAFTMQVWASRMVPVLLKLEGDQGNAEVTVNHSGSSSWETLTFDFSSKNTAALGNVTSVTLIFDNGVLGDASTTPADWTFYLDDINQVAGGGGSGSSAVALPVDFESTTANYSFTDFDGGSVVVEPNPNSGGIDTSATVAKMVKDGGNTWGGSTLALDTAIDFASGKAFSMKVWSQRAVPVLLKLEGSLNNSEVTANHSGSGSWEELSFDFNAVDTAGLGEVTKITLIFDNGNLGDATNDAANWTFWLDDIQQGAGGGGTTPVAIPVDFESTTANYSFSDFDGGSVVIEANPHSGGIDTSATVAKMVKDGGNTWGGSTLSFDTAVDLTSDKVFRMKVWSARAVPVLFKLEHGTEAAKVTEKSVSHNGGSAWEELTFDFSCVDTSSIGTSFSKLTLIFDNGVTGDASNDAANWTFWFDDITQSAGSCAASDPQVAATVPTADPANVTSIFSDAYTDVAGTDFNPSWGQATVVTQPVIGTDNVLKYANLNYQGTQFASALDLSGRSTLHVDYWTSDATSLQLNLISTGPVEAPYNFALVTGSWQAVDIPLSTFSGVADLTDIIQFKVVGDGTVYFDNIYAY